METLLNNIQLGQGIFIISPILSFLVMWVFARLHTHDRQHFLHVVSVSYLALLAFREINGFLEHKEYWVIIFIALISVLSLAWDKSKNTPKDNLLGHYHHAGFSYALALIFTAHALIDGIIFSQSTIVAPGLIIHRIIDGLAIFGLITVSKFNPKTFYKESGFKKFAVLMLFIVAPAIGLYLPKIFSHNLQVVVEQVSVFLLAGLAVLDLQTEIRQRYHNSKKIFIGILLGIFIGLIPVILQLFFS